jgi:uncharacterized protein (DUF1015 family)
MVQIKPFRGIRFNPRRVADLTAVVVPPYDVISAEQQQQYYHQSPHNIIRISFGRDEWAAPGQDRYQYAADMFRQWLADTVLQQDRDDSFYVYSQTYQVLDRTYIRTGLIALFRLVEFGDGIYPHEKTLKGPILDRMQLTEATRAQWGQIFSVYDDREKTIDTLMAPVCRQAPLINITSADGVGHRLWQLADPATVRDIAAAMGRYHVVIADGHHRYTTALQYARNHPENPRAQYVMMTFVNSFSDGLSILPTNRLVRGLADFSPDDLLRKLEPFFTITRQADTDTMVRELEATPVLLDKTLNLKNHMFGLTCHHPGPAYLLQLKDRQVLDCFIPTSIDVYKKLDVNILHKLVIEHVLGITEEVQKEGRLITYVKGNPETIQQLSRQSYQLGFFVRPPLMREVFLTALAHETMPQKATYFYPKVWTGFVVNPLFDIA